METEEQPGGISGSLRRTAETIVRTLQNRAELFGLEMEEEGRWVVSALMWASAAIFFVVLALTIGTLTVVLLVAEPVRPWVLAGFSTVYLLVAIRAILGLKKHFQSRRPPLSETVNELRKDLDWIQSRE